jgi:hypothetical protein
MPKKQANGDRMPLLDIWQAHPNSGGNSQIRVLVAPEFSDAFLEMMEAKGILVKLINDDIQK